MTRCIFRRSTRRICRRGRRRGGWRSLNDGGLDVSVPGTVEEHFWDELGDYVGVSWWWRTFTPPEDLARKRVILKFEAVRLRAEVFLNEELVGYDAVGNTPFEVDVTGKPRPGEPNTLAVRVTDPGGNFTWVDFRAHRWGEQTIPASHGFGGITGSVRLLIADEVYCDDIFVKNKPAVTDVDVEITVHNTTGSAMRRDLRVQILEAAEGGGVVFDRSWPDETVQPGRHALSRSISVPEARPWCPASPNLYVCRVTLAEADQAEVRFGFRWFAIDGVGRDARLRLNGRRIVLRSAISWGFWPVSGIFPTPALAEKNIRAAKSLGLNMLNFHRCIGQPASFDAADELGLLIHEEPGGYRSGGGDAFCLALAREKLLRMVKRDRNRPSLVIYNMINEETEPPTDRHRRDMADAHRLDPTRTITFTSGWAKAGDDPIKLHMRPYDGEQHRRGWYDHHHAAGPGAYRDEFYNDPGDYHLRTDNRGEIVFWGEEGAIATPPRLALIREALEGRPNGWDGADYVEWHDAYERYLDDKGLRSYFPTVDSLCRSLGNIAYTYQGRIIENVRTGNVADAYVINGWEAEKLENHSGVVDCFRNPKGDAEVLARYNAPLYVAAKLRDKVAHAPATVKADFYVVNEVDLNGAFELHVSLRNEAGEARWDDARTVTITGGETYGELIASDVAIAVDGGAGRYRVEAVLRSMAASGDAPSAAREVARGCDELLLVDWKNQALPARGAAIESNDVIRRFVRDRKGLELPRFTEALGPQDYVVIGKSEPIPCEAVPVAQFSTPDGAATGIVGRYYKGLRFDAFVTERTDAGVDFDFGTTGPAPGLGGADYSVRWEGRIRAAESGLHYFRAATEDAVRLWVDGKLLIEKWDYHAPRLDAGEPLDLQAGREYTIRIEYFQGGGPAVLRLLWSTPSMRGERADALAGILRRVHDDGTTAIFMAQADGWARLLAEQNVIQYQGRLKHGLYWLGGNFFVREHPMFAGLPVNQAMNWEYQALVHYGRRRCGLLLEGEEAVVGCVTGHEHKVATAVGVLRHGKGRLVLSTLDILPLLDGPPGPADVARKIFCNYLAFGERPA